MHPITARFHTFFVPCRLENIFRRLDRPEEDTDFEDFITGGPDGSSPGQVPLMNPYASDETNPVGFETHLQRWLGLPWQSEADGFRFNAMPVRAYNKIWSEYYRDQDLQLPADDVQGIENKNFRKICWEKDAFTAARPWTQKGPDVTLPVGARAPIKGLGVIGPTNLASATVQESGNEGISTAYGPSWNLNENAGAIQEDSSFPNVPNIYADLSAATAINVNDFRRAFALQRYQEARARYGSRYTEYLRYLGVTPSDGRLQRPEFLGGGSATIAFSEVLQTQPDDPATSTDGLGRLGGHGVGMVRTRPMRKFIEEHGYIMTMMSCRPKTMYYRGVARDWLKLTKEDFWQKELEQIGQQDVKKAEVYADFATASETFGYQDRYDEYRRPRSRVSGDFQTVLDFWHLGRDLPSNVELNEDFVECNPSKRIFNEQNRHSLWCAINNHLVIRRMVSKRASSRIL